MKKHDNNILPDYVNDHISNLQGLTEEEREEIRTLAVKFRWKYPHLYQHEDNN